MWFQIPAGDFSNDPNMKQFVYLQARFPDAELEQLVLVSFQSAYIYIQTDKTLYTPSSTGENGINQFGYFYFPSEWQCCQNA